MYFILRDHYLDHLRSFSGTKLISVKEMETEKSKLSIIYVPHFTVCSIEHPSCRVILCTQKEPIPTRRSMFLLFSHALLHSAESYM